MPGNSYLFTIDGMNNNENWRTLAVAFGLALGQNQIQEATVVSTGYSGQFGGAAGGNMNYITKSGSNKFHGNAQYYWNGRVLNANDWFDKSIWKSASLRHCQSVGGLVRGTDQEDKLFFFFDTEGFAFLFPNFIS